VNDDSAKTTRGVAFLLKYPVIWLSMALFLAVLPVRPEIVSLVNLEILMLSTTLLFVLSVGQTFVLITAGIDLSLPAVISLTSVVGASIMADGSPLANSVAAVPGAILVMGLLGVSIGALQGIAVARLKMPAFLVSLASLTLIGGLAIWYTQSKRIPVPAAFVEIWYGRLLGIPYPVVVVGVLAVLAHVMLSHTVTGRRLFAVGHNLQTARVSGVPVVRTTVIAYAVSGLCASIASMFYSARLYTGSPQLVETDVLLDCIGAAVIGGTSLFGGKGRILGTLLGVVFIALVGNSLNMLGLRYWHVITAKGGVILVAALLDAVRNRFLANE
jgi:ribose/xylose/arabinose/galactoside ABC-type transport system permease subunit